MNQKVLFQQHLPVEIPAENSCFSFLIPEKILIAMNLSFTKLSVEQINIIKALGIILITLHNFLHWVTGINENEMRYDFSIFYSFMNSMIENPASVFNSVLSYTGHFGVQLFIFASGYGLTKKYLKKPDFSYREYIIPRIVKLYSLLLFGIILYFILIYDRLTLLFAAKTIVSYFSMLKNLSYDLLFIPVGPWWFFSLIFQLYLLFPFLFRYLYKKKEKGFFTLLVISYVVIYALFSFTEKLNVPLFANFPGHIPEFLLGIGLAMFKDFRINGKLFLLAIVVFLLANLSVYIFPLGFLSVTVILLAFSYPLCQSKGITGRLFVYIGNISMYIFIINGPLREYTIPLFIRPGMNPLLISLFSVLHLVISILLSVAASYIFDKTFGPWSGKVIKKLLPVKKNNFNC